ncbi:hypothetical protein BMF94_0120 [Rhodotorula taiwanensis]|uniref:DUF3835 domain-containing protein n=1 Tax=Rhodotorula taiwanensis TaxID=741276 RepID=A0A2S5BJC8_9BASI|nr:hypothetical protein BMF94_0120 [Rhodotorula taiwanensis]
MESVDAALHPLTLPTLPHDLALLSDLKLQLATARQEIHGYARLEGKLESFTDEPVWDAYIPFGPLAYFPGQLVHTNDITAPEDGAAQPPGQGGSNVKAEQSQPSRLRSAKQARLQAERMRTDLEARVAALENEIATKEEELRQKRLNERKKGKGKAADLVGGDMGEEDWTINERGEVINEEGLPMFDIREDLPPEPVASTSSAAADAAKAGSSEAPKRRFLTKKGGKQTIGMLIVPSSSTLKSVPATAEPSPAVPPAASPSGPSANVSNDNPIPDRPRLDIKAILDELEAEERSTAATADAAAEPTATEEMAAEQPKRVEDAASTPRDASAPPIEPKKPASAGFAGFAPGFLSKSKQKRPSNTLQSATAAAAVPSSPPRAGPVQAVAPILADGQPLKPALSRPVSPSRANGTSTPQEKKRVAFDLPPPTPSEEEPAKPKKAPIILGMGDKTPEFDETISSDEFKAGTPASAPDSVKVKEEEDKTPFVRPIRDTVVEKPLRKPVPPGGAPGGGTATAAPVKRVSRFKRMKEEAFDERKDELADKPTTPRPEWKGPPDVLSTSSGADQARSNSAASSSASTTSSPAAASASSIPAPVHTISFKAPAADKPTPEGTMSYADIPYDSNEEDDDDQEEPSDHDSDEDGFGYSDEDEIDEEELDVDAALHAREVALAYHQQRLNLGGGRGTGALGGYHEVGQSPFGNIGRDAQGIVPADATLQSLDPEIAANAFGSYANAGSAQLGKGSRFRNATRNLESAQLIIPSLLAADPTFTTSKEALGPAAAGSSESAAAVDDDGLDESERERLRKTLEAIAEGRPLPEDQQQYERQREIFLREELAQEKEEREQERRARERTAGKQPPTLEQRIPTTRRPEASSAASPDVNAAPLASTVVEKAPAASPVPASPPVAPGAATPSAEAEPPKRMSRFRQKQLGLIE